MGIMLCENMLLFCNTEREGWDTMGVLYCAHIPISYSHPYFPKRVHVNEKIVLVMNPN